jgi:mannosyltransferase
VATSVLDITAAPRDVAAEPTRPTKVAFALTAIVLLGAALRFSTLGVQSFWLDEAYTHAIVAHGLGHALATIPKTESTPPLYYVLVWLWSRIFGTGEVGLRSFSALCGVLTIPVLYLLGTRLVSRRVGLVAALLTAVNPLLFWYSQEARAYALMVLLSAATLVLLVRAVRDPAPRRLLAWGAASAVALATHYFAALAVAPEGIWLLAALARRHEWSASRLASAYAPVAATAAALAPLLIRQNDGRASFLAGSGSVPTRLAQLVKQHVVAYDEPAKVVLSAVAVLLVAGAVALLVLRGRREEQRAAVLPACTAIGGVLLALGSVLLGSDYIDSRNLLGLWPAEAVVVAAGFGVNRAPRLAAAGLATLAAISIACVIAVDVDPLFQRADWRGAAHALGPAQRLRAIVTPGQGAVALTPYLTGLEAFPAAGVAVSEVDVIGLETRQPGAHANSSPPRPAVAPALAGFALASSRETSSYTVLRYLASTPRPETPAMVLALSLGPEYTVVLQRR